MPIGEGTGSASGATTGIELGAEPGAVQASGSCISAASMPMISVLGKMFLWQREGPGGRWTCQTSRRGESRDHGRDLGRAGKQEKGTPDGRGKSLWFRYWETD